MSVTASTVPARLWNMQGNRIDKEEEKLASVPWASLLSFVDLYNSSLLCMFLNFTSPRFLYLITCPSLERKQANKLISPPIYPIPSQLLPIN